MCRCVLPDVLPIDLRVKLAVCIIHFKGLHLVKAILEPLNMESTDNMGDLFLDVAEAFMNIGEYQEALPYLSALASTESYNMVLHSSIMLLLGSTLGITADSIRFHF